MRPGEFEDLLGECRHGARQFAAEVQKRLIVHEFGTTDRERCRRTHKAYCGVWAYIPGIPGKTEIWLCESETGKVFASDDIENAKPFPLSMTDEIHKELEAFAREVEKELHKKMAAAN